MSNKSTFETDLSTLEPYILGKKFTGVAKNITRCTSEIYQKFLDLLEEDALAKRFFDVYTVPADFYRTMVDFNHHIPKEYRTEVFYAAKVGYFSPQVPSFCLYLVTEAWKRAEGMPNMVVKLLPTTAMKKFFEEGYFADNYSLYDVICDLCTENYKPLCLYHPKNKVGDFTEIYVKETDMVAAVPNAIADALDDDSVLAIKLTPNGLETGGVLLRTMGGYVGAINSNYDLRELL